MITEKINHLAGAYLLSADRVSDIVAQIVIHLEHAYIFENLDFEKWELSRLYNKNVELNFDEHLLMEQIDKKFINLFKKKLKTMNSIEVN